MYDGYLSKFKEMFNEFLKRKKEKIVNKKKQESQHEKAELWKFFPRNILGINLVFYWKKNVLFYLILFRNFWVCVL